MVVCRTLRKIEVQYSAPVRDCRRELRIFPPFSRAGQKVLDLQWQCDPPPDETQESNDDFGNRVLQLQHHRIEKNFQFEMSLETSQDLSVPIAPEIVLPPVGIGAFLLPSALCNFTPDIESAARQLKAATPAEICSFVYGYLEYAPGKSNLQTSASQALQEKRGVCQDFAHMMIAVCRTLKMPARYISGYLPGEGAAHAWVEVLQDNRWRSFDPTHNRVGREDYVYVASGRDFRDCASISGSFKGRAKATLKSNCKTHILNT